MEEEYKEKIDVLARKSELEPEDFEFISMMFEKHVMEVVSDVIERRIIIQLAWNAGQYLN